MKKQLTERQEQILSFIHEYRNKSGFPPTLREIGRKFNIASTFGVKRHLEALEKKGYLKVGANASRAISLTPDEEFKSTAIDNVNSQSSRQIPLVGRVAAGSPIMAIENVEGHITIDPTLLRKNDKGFALKVMGDSMINAGIFDDDVVVVASDKEIRNYDIVVAMLDGEVTVKRFEKRNSKIQLIPENDNYSPIPVENKNEFKIVGKVVGVMRWLK